VKDVAVHIKTAGAHRAVVARHKNDQLRSCSNDRGRHGAFIIARERGV
jgi:hypothetical protein